MDDWMRYERVLPELFQQPGTYPYPFGSTNLGHLQEMSEAELRRLPLPRASPPPPGALGGERRLTAAGGGAASG